MKRAKEYAKEIIETFINGDKDSAINKASETIKLLAVDELNEIKTQRKVAIDTGLIGIFREQNNKWKSIVRHVNKEIEILEENGFSNCIGMFYPKITDFINKAIN